MDLQKLIKEIPDFPKKGIVFMDITPIMANPSAYAYAIEKMADMISAHKPDKLLATESRGFFFGPPIALKLGIPFIPIRKKGKLPRETIDVSYQLEYGTDTICVHSQDISAGDRLALLDDILATGGTAEAMCKLAKSAGADIACCAFFMELGFLHGRKRLNGINIESVFVY